MSYSDRMERELDKGTEAELAVKAEPKLTVYRVVLEISAPESETIEEDITEQVYLAFRTLPWKYDMDEPFATGKIGAAK